MRRISTGAEQLLTTDGIADAVVTYAAELARAEDADVLAIPIVLDDGRIDEAQLLLGPASQLTIVPDGDEEVDLPGADDVVRDVRERIARLHPAPITGHEDAEASFPNLDDYE